MAKTESPAQKLNRLRQEREQLLADYKSKKVKAFEIVQEKKRLDREIKEAERAVRKGTR